MYYMALYLSLLAAQTYTSLTLLPEESSEEVNALNTLSIQTLPVILTIT